jgi:hypothetical protein
VLAALSQVRDAEAQREREERLTRNRAEVLAALRAQWEAQPGRACDRMKPGSR